MPRRGPANYLENALMGEGSSASRAADPALREQDYWQRAGAPPVPPADLGVARRNAGKIARYLLGKGEGLLHGVTSAAAQVPAGLAGLHELVGQGLNELKPTRDDWAKPDPAGAMERVRRALTYEPSTPEGQAELESASRAPAARALQFLGQDLPEGLGESMQDAGSGALPAAAVVTGLELLPNLVGGKKGRGAVSKIPWDEMSLAEAKAAAAAGEHLQPSAKGYVGAPRQVKNPQALSGLRARIDRAVEEGSFGADWYERARGAVSEISGDDPAQVDRNSKMLSLYSPQATPDVNMGHALKQINDVVLKGDESRASPYLGYQAPKGREIMAGGSPDLGEKVGVYEQHINPRKAEEAKVRGVNDIWMGRLYGYGNRGFKPAEHSFMTGENLLAAERAGRKGLLPEGTEPNVGTTQAAAWTGERYKQLLKSKAPLVRAMMREGDLEGAQALEAELKERAGQSYDTVLPKYTAGETYEEVPGRSTGHLSRAADLPFEKRDELTRRLSWANRGERDPLYEALGMAQRPTEEGLGQFTETVKRPMLEPALRDPETGKMYTGSSHATALMDLPDDVGERIVNAFEGGTAQGFKKNPEGVFLDRFQAGHHFRKAGGEAKYFQEAGQNPNALASEDLRRGFNPQVDVPVTDYNPNRTARPMVGYGSGARDLDPASASLLEQVNSFRSAADAQAAGAYGATATGSGNAGDAARVQFKGPLSAEATKRLYQKAADAGLDLVDHGGGTFKVTKFEGIKGPEFLKRLRALQPELEGAKVERGGHVGGYQELPWGKPGSGQVTDWLLGKITPRVGEKMTSTRRVRDALLRKNVEELKFKQENPFSVGAPREDLQRLRGLVAKHGLEGVREMVKKMGGGVAGAAKLGLPAVAFGYLQQQGGTDAEAP